MSSSTATNASSAPGTPTTVGTGTTVRLMIMMLLEFMVWGSWFATLGLILATHGLVSIIGNAYSLAAIAAIVSPMFLGALGDRFLASQKVLGIAHLAGSAILFFIPAAISGGRGGTTLLLLFAYMLCFQPTLGLANSIAFRHSGGDQKRFPFIRVFGTAGWVVAGLIVGALGLSASASVFYLSAGAGLAFGLYCFTLPNTPAPAKGVRFSIGDVVGAKAFALFRHRNFAVFMICILLTSISLGVYNTWGATYLGALGIQNVAGVLAIGQASEIVFILVIPAVVARLGMKWALLTGMVMWGIRFALFAVAAETHAWVAIVAIGLHGICSDFVIVIGAMYLDRVTPLQLTAQAQSMLILMISGVGALIGSFVSGKIYGAEVASVANATASAWTPMWYLPIAVAVVTAVLWLALFRGRRGEIVRYGTDEIPGSADRASVPATERATGSTTV